MKAHPVGFGGEVERGALGQPVTNPEITLDTKVKVVETKRMFKDQDWWDIRNDFINKYPDVVNR